MIYTMRDEITNSLLSDNLTILRIDVPFFYKVEYNKDIEKLNKFIEKFSVYRKLDKESALRLTKFISLFYEKDGQRARKIVEGDARMEHVYNKISENSNELIGVYNKASHDKFIMDGYIKEQREEAIKEGLEQGRLEKERTMVLNMLNENIELQMISKISGLSIDEIENIRNGSN